MTGPLYELALSVPWCITDDALEAMLRIAAEDPLPEEEMKTRFHGPKSLALRDGKRRDDSGRMTMHGSVALLPIDGPIYRYADFFTSVSGGVTTASLARDFATAIADPLTSAIVLAIDSPGGEATGINELADTIYAARGTKPIVAYIEGYGASAAYWIASAADLLLIDENASVGSIGTVLGVSDPAKRVSRTIDFVSSQSKLKRADPTTAEGAAYYQTMVDDMTEVFIAKVMRNRGITREQVLAAQGGMLIGEKAIAVGLADGLGSEDGAIGALLVGALPVVSKQFDRSLPRGLAAAKEVNLMAGDQKPVDQKGFWAGFFGGARDAGIITDASEHQQQLATMQAAAAPLMAVQSKSDDDQAHAKEVAELRAQVTRIQAERITSDAQAFAKEQITTGHAYAAEQQQLIALYVQAAQDDASHPLAVAENAAHAPTSRVDLLRTALQARPANRLATNLVDGTAQQGRVLTNTSGATDPYADDVASAKAYGERANGNRAKA
jgi:ClpP class serine protease